MLSEALDPVNPFHEGAAGKYFVGRDDQLKRFTRALTALRKAEPAHLYVAGVNGRGKTSCLEKLVEMARESGILAVRVALDGGVRAQQQILAMFEKLLREIDEIHEGKAGAPCCRTLPTSETSSPSWVSGISSCALTRASGSSRTRCRP